MPKFGQKSLDLLSTCHPDIQKVMNKVIEEYDITVVFGHRTKQEQMELFKKGRKKVNGRWVRVGATVTNIDGLSKMSKHNYSPSKAIDIAPYPIDYDDVEKFIELKEVVFRCAEEVGVKLVWGADWDGDGDIKEHSLQDYPHYELKA